MSIRATLARLLATAALGAGLAAPSAQAAGPPIVEATFVEGVSATGATLWAEINPNGFQTSYRFEYVTEAAFQKSGFTGAAIAPPTGATKIGSGTTIVKVNQHVGSLVPATGYRYRVWVSNAAATFTGPERFLTTQDPTNVFSLPDGRAWEMVSPIDKEGGAIQGPAQNFNGDLDQAAIQGNLFTYSSATAFGNAPGAPPASQYLATRTTSGWTSTNVSTPLHAGAYGEEPDGVPYRLFSADLGKGLLFGGSCRGEESECSVANPPLPETDAPAGYANYYLRSSATGTFGALLSQANVAESTLGPKALEASAVAATSDLSHVVLASCAALSADATEVLLGPGECDAEETNLYQWSSNGLQLINLLPGDTEGTPGAEIGASLGAISTNGSRVYWTQGGDLYLRDGTQSFQVDEALGGGGTFETASADGSVAYFSKGGHLYRYLASTKAVSDLTPAGGVAGVLGASSDGAGVYYQDASGLQLWHEGTTTTVAPGPTAAFPSDYPPATGTARVSPDGAHLAFLSAASLTGADSAGLAEVFLYGPPVGGGTPVLICASCNPTGEKTKGAASIPGAPPNGSSPTAYMPRALSADGQRLFFDSNDVLSFQDSNAAPDVYQWEAGGSGSCQRSPGCTNLISSGRSNGGASFLDASADSSDVFFLTDASLVGADPGSIDVYDAKVGGGFIEPVPPIPCVADACQALPGTPEDPTPGTLVPNSGNPALQIEKEKTKKKSGGKKHGGKKGKGKGHKGKGKKKGAKR